MLQCERETSHREDARCIAARGDAQSIERKSTLAGDDAREVTGVQIASVMSPGLTAGSSFANSSAVMRRVE
jgi:hypothetical protein